MEDGSDHSSSAGRLVSLLPTGTGFRKALFWKACV